jgi:glucose-6-phosphate isomerase
MRAAGLLLDYSKNRIGADTVSLLMSLARERGVEALRDAMFAARRSTLPNIAPSCTPRCAHPPMWPGP